MCQNWMFSRVVSSARSWALSIAPCWDRIIFESNTLDCRKAAFIRNTRSRTLREKGMPSTPHGESAPCSSRMLAIEEGQLRFPNGVVPGAHQREKLMDFVHS